MRPRPETARLARTHLVKAEGSPSATLVVHTDDLPDPGERPTPALRALRRSLHDAGHRDVTKVAVVSPSHRPGFDMDYRFVQVLAGDQEFELRGSCGHSILAACSVALDEGWLGGGWTADRPVRVNVLNNGDAVRCSLVSAVADTDRWDIDFHRAPPTPVSDLLLFDEPTVVLRHQGRPVAVSAVSTGNPYVFVSAADVGAPDRTRLFTDDHRLFDVLSALRETAEAALGWPSGGVFPKIAALLPAGRGQLAVRAISVPRWHPAMAITGAVCLAAATNIPGTVARRLAGERCTADRPLTIHTPGGRKSVTATLCPAAGRQAGALAHVGLRGSTVHHLGRLSLSTAPLPAALAGGHR